jgi:CubicO group peptidase (beta-lactamase class C family)
MTLYVVFVLLAGLGTLVAEAPEPRPSPLVRSAARSHAVGMRTPVPRPRRARRCGALGLATSVVLLGSACTGETPAGGEEPDSAARIEAALSDQVDNGGALSSLRAVLVAQDGETVVEKYFDTVPEQEWAVQSVTKSVMSTLVGIAVEEGALDLDSTLGELLPDRRHLMSDKVRAATLGDLLTMSAGFTEEGAPEEPRILRESVAPVDRALLRATGPSGFAYSNAGTQVLSAVLAEATGTSVLDYARSKLFDPLGVDSRPAWEEVGTSASLRAWEQAGFAWPVDREGNHFGWGYLKLRPRDMLKLGQLYLDAGVWDGEQLVPEPWVKAATTTQVSTDVGAPLGDYGYLWWVGELDGETAAVALGFGCQVIAVVPARQLVVAIATELKLSEPAGPTTRGLSPGSCLTILESAVVVHVS